MGNKNARGNAAMFPRRPQVAVPTTANASSGDVAVSHNKTESSSGSSDAKIETKPGALAFRSYQTGTLHGGPSELPGSVPAQHTVGHPKSRLSPTSAVFVPSSMQDGSSSHYSPTVELAKALLYTPAGTPNHGLASFAQVPVQTGITIPTGPSNYSEIESNYRDYHHCGQWYKFIREIITRENKYQKDVVIEYNRVHRNIISLYQLRDADGNVECIDSGDYAYGSYYLEYDLAQMSRKERCAFWTSNWVEIIVDVGLYDSIRVYGNYTVEEYNEMCDKSTLETVGVMNELGPEFATQTRTVFITIRFPEETESKTPAYLKQTLSEQLKSRAYRTVQNISDKLKEFTSLQRLEIILCTQAHSRNPLALPQLHFALPFYELKFTKWQLKWQNSYMSQPEEVRGWSITHLDIERAKIDRQLFRAQQEKEQEEVFVHASASPGVHDLPFAPRDNASKTGHASKTSNSSKTGNAFKPGNASKTGNASKSG